MTYSPPSVSENQKCRSRRAASPRHRQRLGTGGNVQTVNVGVSHRRQPRCAGDAVRAEVLHVRGDLRARLEVVGERVRGANREIENATGEERSDGRPGRHLILVGGHGKVRGERAARQHAKRVRRGMRRAPECHVHHVVSRLSGRESQQILSSPEILHRRRLPVHVHHRRRVRAMVHHVFLVRDRGHDPRGFAAHASLVPVLVVSLHQKRRRPLLPTVDGGDSTVDSGDTQPSGEVAPGHPNDTFERVTAR